MPIDPPEQLVMDINLAPPPRPGAYADDLPYESDAAWSIAVETQQKKRGLTRGHPLSPRLPKKLIVPCDTDPSLAYTRIANVGAGTYGTVDIMTVPARGNRKYALKKMDVEDRDDEGLLLMAQREAIIMKKLQHARICKLYRASILDGRTVFLLMDACSMNLHEYIRQVLRKMTEGELAGFKIREIKYMAKALLEGMIYMHGEGVLHRDLKSGNILLKRNGSLKITDFGLARKIEKEKPTDGRRRHYSERVGTYTTMAPEVMGRTSDYGFETDMWSVACVIGEMFACKTIFNATVHDDTVSELNAIMRLCGNITFRPPHPPGLKTTGNTRRVREFFATYVTDHDALALLDKAFTLPKERRLTAEEMSHMEFFSNGEPAPINFMRDPENYPFLGPAYTWPEYL